MKWEVCYGKSGWKDFHSCSKQQYNGHCLDFRVNLILEGGDCYRESVLGSRGMILFNWRCLVHTRYFIGFWIYRKFIYGTSWLKMRNANTNNSMRKENGIMRKRNTFKYMSLSKICWKCSEIFKDIKDTKQLIVHYR